MNETYELLTSATTGALAEGLNLKSEQLYATLPIAELFPNLDSFVRFVWSSMDTSPALPLEDFKLTWAIKVG